MLIDEADALAQSREAAQMHHEDRAGVNALIRGIDELANGRLPAIVILCTNRLDALDPAVRRRAAHTFEFDRPSDEQRSEVIKTSLEGIGLKQPAVNELVRLTGPTDKRPFGFTYSDLTQRLLPAVLLEAFPERGVDEQLSREFIYLNIAHRARRHWAFYVAGLARMIFLFLKTASNFASLLVLFQS